MLDSLSIWESFVELFKTKAQYKTFYTSFLSCECTGSELRGLGPNLPAPDETMG